MTRRFISGAECPSCGAMDKLVIYVVEERDHFECVACGHIQKRPTIEEMQKEQETKTAEHSMDTQIVELKTTKK